jgi:nucleotide-binding universal stress UspA family protein
MKFQTTDRQLHILLAEDGSQHAMAAAALLRDLLKDEAREPRSSVTVLNVFTPRQISEHEALHAALDQTRALLEGVGIPVVTEQVLGYPAEKLMEFAQDHRPDLIVIGAQGLRNAGDPPGRCCPAGGGVCLLSRPGRPPLTGI